MVAGQTEPGRFLDGRALVLSGQVFAMGLGTHRPFAEQAFNVFVPVKGWALGSGPSCER